MSFGNGQTHPLLQAIPLLTNRYALARNKYWRSPLNVAFNSSKSSANVNYYTRDGEYKFNRSVDIVCDSPYDHAYAEIPVSSGEYEDGWTIYAKSGNMYVQVDRTGTDSIKEAAFVFGYGHTVIAISPSLSLPASFGIGFSWGTEKMVEEASEWITKELLLSIKYYNTKKRGATPSFYFL